MTNEVRKGHTLFFIIAGILLGFPLLILTTNFGAPETLRRLVRLIINILFLVMLYRGYSWAKWVVGVLAILGGVMSLVGSLGTMLILGPTTAIFLMLFAVLYIVSGIYILGSSNLHAFLDYQEARRTGEQVAASV